LPYTMWSLFRRCDDLLLHIVKLRVQFT
jgi:hypothetical protein